tara:strand:+ start:104 stop:550 length:447 start_codon:yes stop_codon:yes gene_type:complete
MSDTVDTDPFFGALGIDLGIPFQVTDLFPEAPAPLILKGTPFQSIEGLEGLSVMDIETLGPVLYLNPQNMNRDKIREVSRKRNPETMEGLPVYIYNLNVLTEKLKDVAYIHRTERIRLLGVVDEKQQQINALEEKISLMENPSKKRKV